MIPLLIKEKVQNYYYFNQWKENIKLMHEQYYENVKLVAEEKLIRIYNAYYSMKYNFTKIMKIFNFITHNSTEICFPQKYQYSSGLDHPTAFK